MATALYFLLTIMKTKLISLPQEVYISEDELLEKMHESAVKDQHEMGVTQSDLDILKSGRIPFTDDIYRSVRPFNSQGDFSDAFFLWKFVFKLLKEKIGGDMTSSECAYLYVYEPDDPCIEMLNDAMVMNASAETFAEMPMLLAGLSAVKCRDFYTLQEFRSANTDDCLYKAAIKNDLEWIQECNKYNNVTGDEALKRLKQERGKLIMCQYNYSTVMEVWTSLGFD